LGRTTKRTAEPSEQLPATDAASNRHQQSANNIQGHDIQQQSKRSLDLHRNWLI
jgi:hypothetical protein